MQVHKTEIHNLRQPKKPEVAKLNCFGKKLTASQCYKFADATKNIKVGKHEKQISKIAQTQTNLGVIVCTSDFFGINEKQKIGDDPLWIQKIAAGLTNKCDKPHSSMGKNSAAPF